METVFPKEDFQPISTFLTCMEVVRGMTVIALRMVKDHIVRVAGTTKVSIKKQLISFVKSGRQRYECDLKANRKRIPKRKMRNSMKNIQS